MEDSQLLYELTYRLKQAREDREEVDKLREQLATDEGGAATAAEERDEAIKEKEEAERNLSELEDELFGPDLKEVFRIAFWANPTVVRYRLTRLGEGTEADSRWRNLLSDLETEYMLQARRHG